MARHDTTDKNHVQFTHDRQKTTDTHSVDSNFRVQRSEIVLNMFRNLNFEDLAVMALLLLDTDEEEIDRAVVKKRSIWVHILKKRKVEGEHATLYKELKDYEDKFFKYFRMSK
jgi:hypothetical protein